MTNNFIYALIRGDTKELFYVGKTCNSIKRRLYTHMWAAKKPGRKNKLYAYMSSLLKKSIKIEAVELGRNYKDINEAEKQMISSMKSSWPKLKNEQPGGEGQPKGYQFKKRHVPPKGIQPESLRLNKPKPYLKTQEIIEKYKQTRQQNKKGFISLVCINLKTKNKLNFSSLAEAAKFFNLPPSNLSRKLKLYKNTPLKEDWYVIRSEEYSDNLYIEPHRKNQKKVVCINNLNEFKYFSSIKDLAIYLNTCRKKVYRAIRSNKIINGMRCSYV